MTATATAAALDGAAERQLLQDRLDILELTGRLGLMVDARDWAALADLFTDPVEVDYTSLNGGTPQNLKPADLLGGWRQVLDHLDGTQHLIAGQVTSLDGDHATCAATVQGTHVPTNATGGPIWTVGGRYDFGLLRTPPGWRIAALTLTVHWATGNQHIMQIAGARH
jgi:hypothetical protein